MENKPPKTTDERIDVITMNLELLSHTVEARTANSVRDAESIRTLARIAEIYERRLTALEGGNQ